MQVNDRRADHSSTQNPLRLLFRATVLWASRRLRFLRDLDHFALEDNGEAFHAFRKMVVDGTNPRVKPPAASFKVRFKFKNLSPKANRRLSVIPIPLIAAQPGFRSKTWLTGECSGDFMGYYEFDTKADAEAYRHSLPLWMIRARARAGSLSFEVGEIRA